MRKRNIHPYDDDKIIKTEEHDGRKYELESAMLYVVDDYDPYIGSVELSHYERLNYFELVNFTKKEENNEILDLRWMDEKDVINLKPSTKNGEIKTIIVNINNLDCSYFRKYKNFDKINFIIENKESNKTDFSKIRIFKSFIEENIENIESVQLRGFNSLLKSILKKYLSINNVKYIVETKSDNNKQLIK